MLALLKELQVKSLMETAIAPMVIAILVGIAEGEDQSKPISTFKCLILQTLLTLLTPNEFVQTSARAALFEIIQPQLQQETKPDKISRFQTFLHQVQFSKGGLTTSAISQSLVYAAFGALYTQLTQDAESISESFVKQAFGFVLAYYAVE